MLLPRLVSSYSRYAPLFLRIQIADGEYKKAFIDELAAFKQRIRTRAKEKIEEQMEEIRKEQEEEREARLGPGGLDPAEVFETLPKVRDRTRAACRALTHRNREKIMSLDVAYFWKLDSFAAT